MIIAICDDESKECAHISRCVEKYIEADKDNIEIITYEPDEFRQSLNDLKDNNATGNGGENNRAIQWDIVIMDIEFKDKAYDGIALTKKLNEVCSKCQVIYLTHILEFAPEVYDTEHCYFVMKNNMDVMLPKALTKAIDIYKASNADRPLEVMSEGHMVYIHQEEICFVEKKQRQTIIHTNNRSYPCYESISALSKRVGDNVIRCHGGYLVNLSHITYLGGEKVLIDIDDIELPLGKTYKEQTKQAYLKYWMKRM